MRNCEIRIQGATVHLRTLAFIDIGKAHFNRKQGMEITQDLEYRIPGPTRRPLVLFAVVTNNGGHYVGNIKIGPVSARDGVANVLVKTRDESYWEAGIATEAIRLATRYAFSYLSLRRLTAVARACDVAAVRAHEEAGFQVEGIRGGQTPGRGSDWDQALMGMAAVDWSAQVPLTLPLRRASEESLAA